MEQRGSGDEKSYRHTLMGLDPARAHDFRVAGQKRDCGATMWSDVVSLSPPAPPPAPDYAVTVNYGDGAVALVVTPSNAPAGITGYTLRHRVKGSDADYVEVSADPDDAADGIEVSGVTHGEAYRVGLRASNQVGDGEYAYRDVTALVVPAPPSFTLSPVYRKGEAHLAESVASPDPHASCYLLKVGEAEAVSHTGLADLRLPVVPGETYTVGQAAGNSAGAGAFTTVTRATTTTEFEALLEWRLIAPDQATPAEAVGDATQYVAIVNGKPVRYDPVAPCVGRETALAQSRSDQATALAAWVDGLSNASADLAAYAGSHKTAMAGVLTAAKTAATTACQARHPVMENLGQNDACWVRMPR